MLKLEQMKDIDIKKETFKDVEGRGWRKTRAVSLQGAHTIGAHMHL